jgi:UDP-N-acetylmuramoyl-tripeptide--D-alanyl-D-alanine ligase
MNAARNGQPLWTAGEAAAATGGRIAGSWTVQDVAIDTRGMPEGSLFVALEGEHRDGHDFVRDALAKGAAAMVSRRDPSWGDQPLLLEVADTMAGLEALGRAGRARTGARIAAVTGSVGKTGTKEALRHVLARQAPAHASAASHNNHWGVPLSLARMPRDTAFAAFELGMNHPGEIRSLVAMVRPDVALITRIAPAHLAFLGTIEAIADAKAEIFEGLRPGGSAVLPSDDPQFERLAAHARAAGSKVVSFGQSAAADWRLERIELGPESSRLTVSAGSREFVLALGAPGRHWALNAVGVLAVVDLLGADARRAAWDLAAFTPPAGRGQRRPVRLPDGEALLLDESYNANPVSMEAAIELLGAMPGRRIAVLGDMLELGAAGPKMHAGLSRPIEKAKVDAVFSCGPLMAHLDAALSGTRRGGWAESSVELAPQVLAALRPGDVVLIKGSLGSRMQHIVDALEARGA